MRAVIVEYVNREADQDAGARGAARGAERGAGRGAERGADRGAERGAERGASAGALAPRSPALPGERGASGPRISGTPDGRGAQCGAHGGAQPGAERGALTVAQSVASLALQRVLRGGPIDAETVIVRLEEAGRALLSLPNSGYSTRLRIGALQPIREVVESYGWDTTPRLRAPMPDSRTITRMDEALAWIPLIPGDRYVLRRIVGCRALVSPLTERHLFSWRRIGGLMGADHKAVQRWHAEGIDRIVAAVNG